jgi:secretion/DNA translocation related TadE-like protein
MMRSDRGSGTVLAVGIVGCIVGLAVVVVPLYRGLGALRQIQGAADASALAGADVAAGIAPGSPCGVAVSVARANDANTVKCRADGLVVTVTAGGSFLGFSLVSTATAGPPVG